MAARHLQRLRQEAEAQHLAEESSSDTESEAAAANPFDALEEEEDVLPPVSSSQAFFSSRPVRNGHPQHKWPYTGRGAA